MESVSYGPGADLSLPPSLPVGDDRYLNLSSQKRPTARNLGGNRSVRRSGTTSRGTVALVFCLHMPSLIMSSLIMCTSDCGSGCFKVLWCILSLILGASDYKHVWN